MVHSRIEECKKKLGINKIAGLMMLHYFKWPWCLEELSSYVDDIFLLLHFSPDFRADWPRGADKVRAVQEIEMDSEWQVMEWRSNQPEFRERLIRMADDARPDIVLFPDEDESFPEPELFAEDLYRLIRSGKNQMAYKRCNFWDSMDTVRKDRWVYYGPHVKMYRWEQGLTYKPYLGYNRVTNYGKKTLTSRSVIRHYAYMERSERERRYNVLYRERQKRFSGLLSEPKLVKYVNARKAPRT